jgi:hypothetical protein
MLSLKDLMGASAVVTSEWETPTDDSRLDSLATFLCSSQSGVVPEAGASGYFGYWLSATHVARSVAPDT